MWKRTAAAVSVAALAGGAGTALPEAEAQSRDTAVQIAACGACNPCAAGAGACSPCAADSASTSCQPCNPCAAKNPCGPCAAANPCNPCAAE